MARARLALLAAMVAAAPLGAAPPAWNGRYVYEQSLGRNVPGVAMFVTHQLTLGRGTCRIKSDGYQTDELIHCTTAPIPGGLAVKFASWEDGRIVNRHDVRVYDPGAVLFTLTRPRGTLLTSKGRFFQEDRTPELARRFVKAR